MKEKALVAICLIFVIIAVIISFLIAYKSYEFNKEFGSIIFFQQGKVAQGNVHLCIDIELPNMSSIGNLNATENVAFSYTVTAESPSNSTIYFYDDTDLFEINVNTGVISFTPNSSQVGVHTVTIWATHGFCPGSGDYETITFTIFAAPYVPPPPVEPPPSGGAAPSVTCVENWSCSSWSQCKLASEHENETYMFELCLERNVLKEKCGFMVRVCSDLNKCNTTLNKPEIFEVCIYTPLPVPIVPPPAIPRRELMKCGDKFCEIGEIFTCFRDCWPFWMIMITTAIMVYVTVKNRIKSKKESVLKELRRIRMEEGAKTDIDSLLILLKKFKKLDLDDVTYAFETSSEKVSKWFGILEKKGAAEIIYPAFGEIKLKLKEK